MRARARALGVDLHYTKRAEWRERILSARDKERAPSGAGLNDWRLIKPARITSGELITIGPISIYRARRNVMQ